LGWPRLLQGVHLRGELPMFRFASKAKIPRRYGVSLGDEQPF
jgi:hypothetical protein